MSEDKDNENEFERDFSEGAEEETTLNEDTSDLIQEEVLENDIISSTNGSENTEEEIDPIAEANESLITMNPAPFDKTLEAMSQTLSSIDNKMDLENLQLQKLDQLSEIKEQLNRMEDVSVATATASVSVDPEPEITAEAEEDVSQSNIGHNQQEISELLEKIDVLEKKIITIESKSNDSNERFKKIEGIVERFEDLESEIQVEYEEEEKPNFFKNLFKKKDRSEPYVNNINFDETKIQLEKIERIIPKEAASIIEEAENSLENTTNETLINENYKEEITKEDIKPKTNNLQYGLGMLLLLFTIIIILFFFDKFEIIDLNFNQVWNSVFSLINSLLK